MFCRVALSGVVDHMDGLGGDAGDYCCDNRSDYLRPNCAPPRKPQCNGDATDRCQHNQRPAEVGQDCQNNEARGNYHTAILSTCCLTVALSAHLIS